MTLELVVNRPQIHSVIDLALLIRKLSPTDRRGLSSDHTHESFLWKLETSEAQVPGDTDPLKDKQPVKVPYRGCGALQDNDTAAWPTLGQDGLP